MHKFRREVDHKLRVLIHADQIGDVGKACRYFGVGRASFYRWRTAYRRHGMVGLENRETAPKNPANQTAPEIVEKVLHLRKTYQLGPTRIVWYLARYHAITTRVRVSIVSSSAMASAGCQAARASARSTPSDVRSRCQATRSRLTLSS